MSNNEEIVPHDGEDISSIEIPSKSKVGNILQELEVLALRKNGNSGLDLSNFSEQQTEAIGYIGKK
jgi:hypothetical protein